MKVYLAKSYLADEALVTKVRKELSKLTSVEIYEYKKTTSYSNHDLISADLVIVIPPKDSDKSIEFTSDDEITVGKGLYSQIEQFLEYNPSNSIISDLPNLFIILSKDLHLYSVIKDDMYPLVDENSGKKDYEKYGRVSLDFFEALQLNELVETYNDELEDKLEDEFQNRPISLENTISESPSNNYLLLLC